MVSSALHPHRVRRRSVGFLERDGETWACYLVTYPDAGQRWHGYLSFRPGDGEMEEDEIRTADIFLEESEAEVDRKARGMGRPLLNGLLASAIHTASQETGDSPRLKRWFREMLATNSREIQEDTSPEEPAGEASDHAAAADGADGARVVVESESADAVEGSADADGSVEVGRLRSLYESYQMDQVAHFISLVRPDDFRETVDTILDGRSFEFGAKDRLQFAMIVVEYIEQRLPLPPFEIWAEDYLSNQSEYQLYTHTLHREGRLP